MNKLKNIIYVLGLSIAFVLTGCSDPDDEILSIDYDRLFSPTKVTARVVSRTNILMTWNKVKDAESYTIEVFANGDLNFDGTPVQTITGVTATTYTVTGLEGETAYSIRIQAVATGIDNSNWISGTVKTDTEQIMQSVSDDDLQATAVTLRWTAGSEVTSIVLTPGDITHTVTAEEKAAGIATITGLTGETSYKATLYNGTKIRGSATFTTLIDLGDATGIYPGDDLVAILDAAADGDAFVIFPGEYDLGAYEITKSIKLSGYKSSDKPVIYGQLTCGSAVNFIELKSLTFRGDREATKLAQFFNLSNAACDLKTLSLNDCDISNYGNQLIYNNVAGKIGDFIISGCIIHDIEGSGGDGIDFRGGTLGSMTVENTTFYNAFRTFLRMQAAAGPISFTNCTFYKISNFDNGNNHGLFRIANGDTFSVINCLLVETGNATSAVATAGNFCRQESNMKASTSYSKNIYYSCYNLWTGLYTNPSQCSATEADPQFADPAKGDFTVGNILVTAGDPRWLE